MCWLLRNAPTVSAAAWESNISTMCRLLRSTAWCSAPRPSRSRMATLAFFLYTIHKQVTVLSSQPKVQKFRSGQVKAPRSRFQTLTMPPSPSTDFPSPAISWLISWLILYKCTLLTNSWVARVSWLENAYSHPLCFAGNFDPQNRSHWPSFWCTMTVH